MEKYIIKNEYITLTQFLKDCDFVYSGGMAKHFLKENEVYLNGEKETRRGKKIYPNDKITINKKEYLFVK